ncbi:hypothetical protein K505DRAFT_417828 [Melanomma pulvis-pyrius CBS 109.77]|uniref:Uncharacterized protein n=1 Tax=Melanomma pulvis-pyrius CBS 109.77 TaxID=1314802 RepID=A0A6A6XAK8_9PLEO|nr:hypothetical protein K505DRAFT_417828 [Melanomma pulvis-pyrius CBS 109.77]
MSLLLVPYNDSMRLGQGFNSFTHELCIDRAVKVNSPKTVQTNVNQSQVVSYSARFVEKLSDVMDTMNVSYCSSVKKGTIEISGNTSTVDETTFKSSDLNAVVSVKVVNQTQSLEDGCLFQPIDDVVAGSSHFNQVYGDCYISGFIEGGDFTGIISMKALDRSNKDKTVKEIKNAFGSSSKESFTLDAFDSGSASSVTSATRGTECTVSVSWMGGGQIKDETTTWDLDSMHKAAAAFPAKVASCPQRTWAILTKYKANRSFVMWSKTSSFKALEYDQISSFTAELFDNFMEYKLLIKQLQTIINNRDNYQQKSLVVNAIDTSMSTLLSVRSALRIEQSKIVQAMEVLSKDPGILKRQKSWSRAQKSPLVNAILKNALGDWGYESPHSSMTTETNFLPLKAPASTEAPATGPAPASIETEDAQPKHETKETERGAESDDDSFTKIEAEKVSTSSLTPADAVAVQPKSQQEELTFNFDSLVPPEIWEDLMPQQLPEFSQTGFMSTTGSTSQNGINGLTGLGGIPPPPPDGYIYPETQILKSTEALKQEIATAKAETEAAQKTLQTTQAELNTMTSKVMSLSSEINRLNSDFSSKLEGERSAKASAERTRDATISERDSEKNRADREKARADDLEARRVPRPDRGDSPRVWISAIIYGDRFITDGNVWNRAYSAARDKNNFQVTNDWFGCDPKPGQWKTATIVYRYDDRGNMRYLVMGEGGWARFNDW